MTAAQAKREVDSVYVAAFEGVHSGVHAIYSGPVNRVVIGSGSTSAQAWKSAAAHVRKRWPLLPPVLP
jgi:hypothetical protein